MTDSTLLQPEGLEKRYERYKEKIKHFTIMNDIFMRNVLKETACTEYILQVIMDMKELKVIDQTLQKDYKNLQERSAILDCVARDAENHHFNVEIQGVCLACGNSEFILLSDLYRFRIFSMSDILRFDHRKFFINISF